MQLVSVQLQDSWNMQLDANFQIYCAANLDFRSTDKLFPPELSFHWFKYQVHWIYITPDMTKTISAASQVKLYPAGNKLDFSR